MALCGARRRLKAPVKPRVARAEALRRAWQSATCLPRPSPALRACHPNGSGIRGAPRRRTEARGRGMQTKPGRVVIEAGREDRQYLRDLWRYRELLVFLAWRNVT